MIGILCGFSAEAKVARRLTPLVAMSTAVEHIARQRAEQLVASGATSILSFGIAGGLSPTIANNSVIVAANIIDADRKNWPCDLLQAIRSGVQPQQQSVTIVMAAAISYRTCLTKRRIYQDTGCAIVDMESHVVAEVATKHGLPFAILRGVSDRVDAPFPEAAFHALCGNADGTANYWKVAKCLIRKPTDIADCLSVIIHTRNALRELAVILDRLKSSLSPDAA